MSDSCDAQLACWLASAPVRWVARSGLARVAALRAQQVLQASGRLAGPESRALLDAWSCAIADAGWLDAAVAAAAIADWAGGSPRVGASALSDRAVDLTLRASAIASDVGSLAELSERPWLRLACEHEVVAGLVALLLGERPGRLADALALDIEDGAGRAAGAAIVAELLANQGA